MGESIDTREGRQEVEPFGQSIRTTPPFEEEPPANPVPIIGDSLFPEWQCALPTDLIPTHCALKMIADIKGGGLWLGPTSTKNKEGNIANLSHESSHSDPGRGGVALAANNALSSAVTATTKPGEQEDGCSYSSDGGEPNCNVQSLPAVSDPIEANNAEFGGGDPPPSSQTECEIKIARAFGDEGAYFSDPHDGDAVDLTTGMSPIGNANAAKQSSGDNHLYGSATDPDARTAFYLPAGLTANLVNLNPNPRAKIPQYMGRLRNGDSYFIIQFPELNQSLIVYHGINVGLGDPDATGRRKVAEMGDGGGGESNFRSSDPSKRPSTVWRKSYHYHLEMMNGLLKSFPAKKPWASFDTLCASLK